MKFVILVLFGGLLVASDRSPLLTHPNHVKGRYIVKFKNDINHDNANFKHTLEDDVEIFFRFNRLFDGFTANMTEEQVELLLEADDVEFIEEDEIVKASSVASWGIDRIDQRDLPLDDAFNPVGDGRDIDVYLVDSGVNADHEDFGGRVSFGFDAVGADGCDCDGHGTHCAGIVGGLLYGVAKSVNIINVRVLNCVGLGTVSGILAATEWIAKTVNETGRPSIASFSLGGDGSTIFDAAVQDLVDENITVIVAAGNDDEDACYSSPARSNSVITVGASTPTDARASFSNYGPCVDIFAPGTSIVATWIGSPTSVAARTGTSMAVPHVSGAAAVFLGNNPTMTPHEVTVEVLGNATRGVLTGIGSGSPNRLVYVGFPTDNYDDPYYINTTSSISDSINAPYRVNAKRPSVRISKQCVVMAQCVLLQVLRANVERPFIISSAGDQFKAIK